MKCVMSADRVVDGYLADILEGISDIRSFTKGLAITRLASCV